MIFSFLRFTIINIIIIGLYLLTVFLFNDMAYFIVTVPFIILYIFKRVDALICYNILSKNKDSKIVLRTKSIYTLTYIGEYNLEGLSYVKVPMNIEYIGLPKITTVLHLRYPISTSGEFFLRKNMSFKYIDELYIDTNGYPVEDML